MAAPKRRIIIPLVFALLWAGAGLAAQPRSLAAPSAEDPYDLCALIPVSNADDANAENTIVGTWEDWMAEFESTEPVPPELQGAPVCYESSDTVAVFITAVADTDAAQRLLTPADEEAPQATRPLDDFGDRAIEALPYSATGEDTGFTIYLHTIVFVRGCYLVWGLDDLEEGAEPPPDSELRRVLTEVDSSLQQRPACPEGIEPVGNTGVTPTAEPSAPTATGASSEQTPEGDADNSDVPLTLTCATLQVNTTGTVLCTALVGGAGPGLELTYNWFLDDEFVADQTGPDFRADNLSEGSHTVAVWAGDATLANTTETVEFAFVRELDSPTAASGAPTATPRPSGSVPTQVSKFPNPEPVFSGRMTLQLGQRQVVAGELVWVPVWLVDAASVANVNFEVVYDAAVVATEGEVTAGNVLGNQAFSSNTRETGVVLAGFAGSGSISGTGTVAWIPFRATGQPGDRTALTVNVTTINDARGTTLAITRIDGEILLVDANGLVPGDCDGDTLLNEVDALCALQMSVRRIPEQLVLDLDNSGAVDSRDAVLILQRALRGT